MMRTLLCCMVLIVGLSACSNDTLQKEPAPLASKATVSRVPAATLGCSDIIQITKYSGHLLVDIVVPDDERSDNVQLIKPDQDIAIPVGLGSVLDHGDILKLAEGTSVTVMCDNSLQPVVISSPGDTLANVCSPPDGTLTVDGLRIDTLRGPGLDMPVMMSPLGPNVVVLPTTLRWYHTGVDNYKLCFRQGFDDIECIEDIRPTIVVPTPYAAVPELPPHQIAEYELTDPPELSPGKYILEIASTDAFSEAQRVITLLGEQSEEVVAAIQHAEQVRNKLDERGISVELQTLTAAHIYTAAGLYNEAMEHLEPLTQSQDKEVRLSAYMLLALLYEQNDLAYEAVESYEAALEIVQEHHPSQIKRQADILFGYGRSWLSFGNEFIDQARPYLSQARDYYERLNMTDWVCWIDEELGGVENE